MAGCMLAAPASARVGERVDFNGTVTSIRDRNTLIITQPETGRRWVVNDRNQNNRGQGRNRNYNNFQIGQRVHVSGMQTGQNSIRAEQIDGAQAYNNGGNYRNRNNRNYNNQNANLNITNPAQGMSVPGSFNVQGNAAPYSQVRVTVNGNRTLLPGVINVNLPGQQQAFTGQADANGHFDIQVQAGNAGQNSQMQVSIYAVSPNGVQSQTRTINLIRQ